MRKKIFNLIRLLSRTKKTFILIITDYFLINSSFLLSYLVYYNSFSDLNFNIIFLFIFISSLAIPIYFFFGLYRSLIEFIGYESILDILKAVTFYFIFLSLFLYFLNFNEFSKRILFISYLFILVFTIYIRFLAKKIIYDFLIQNKSISNNYSRKVMIYGANKLGIQIYNNIRNENNLKFLGFIDSSESKKNQFIEKHFIHSLSEIEDTLKKNQVSEIIFPEQISNKIVNKFDSLNKIYNFKLLFAPSSFNLLTNFGKKIDLKELNIQNLISRKLIDPIPELIDKNIYNKNLLITGAGGSVGSELVRIIFSNNPKTLIMLDKNEYNLFKIYNEIKGKASNSNIKLKFILLDILEKNKLDKIIKKYKINVFFHAAAYKHVNIVEHNVAYSLKNNVVGTLNCVDSCLKNKVENFVLISSDKAVRPSNYMGASKRFSELILLYYSKYKINTVYKTNYSSVRFGNVVGSSGSVIPLFEKQIQKGGPITITDKLATRYFMSINEAAELVIQASSISQGGNIFVLDMGQPISIDYIAKKMIDFSGLKHVEKKSNKDEIEIIYTGLSKGEKLNEELFINNKYEKTQHPKIYKASEKFEDDYFNIFENDLEKLLIFFEDDNLDQISEIIKKWTEDFSCLKEYE